MGRKRGELPTPAEATLEMNLQNGWICIDVKYEKSKDKTHPSGKRTHTKVKLKNINTGEETKWLFKHSARAKYGIKSDYHRKGKHTDKTIKEQVEKLTNENAKVISWCYEKGNNINIKVKIQFKCGCIVEKRINAQLTPDCPICSAKWKTEDAVCKLVEKIAETLYDKDVNLTAHRQHTVYMEVKGEQVNRRYDVAVELTHKHDETIKRWVYIEYNGEQHYRPVNFGNLEEDELMRQFKGNVERDKQKAEYCKENDIPLIVIPYWKKNEIEEILNDKLVSAVYGEACGCWVQYVDKYFL